MFSGFSSDSKVPFGNLANASSVGANTVKGPSLFNVFTRSAALTAATRVLKLPALTAVSTMSFFASAACTLNVKLNSSAPNNNFFICNISSWSDIKVPCFNIESNF